MNVETELVSASSLFQSVIAASFFSRHFLMEGRDEMGQSSLQEPPPTCSLPTATDPCAPLDLDDGTAKKKKKSWEWGDWAVRSFANASQGRLAQREREHFPCFNPHYSQSADSVR